MTLEELLNLTADEWDKRSEEELLAWSKQFEHITRPERVVKTTTSAKVPRKTQHTNSLVQEALKMAAQFGIKPQIK